MNDKPEEKGLEQNLKTIKNNDRKMTIIMIAIFVLTIAMIVPFMYVSKNAYPWADDFGDGSSARAVFLKTGSVLKTIVEGFRSSAIAYTSWMGNYTTSFLAALQPAVFSMKLYHLSGPVLVVIMLLAYVLFGYMVFGKVLKMQTQDSVIIGLLIYLFSVECVIGVAEAFNWYVCSYPYTFIHSMLVVYFALIFKCVFTGKCGVFKTVPLCLLGVIVAGGNNISAFSGILLLLAILVFVVIFADRQNTLYYIRRLIPFVLSYGAGYLVNVLAPGHRVRAQGFNLSGSDYFATVLYAFGVCAKDIVDKFSWELFAVLCIIGVLAWRNFSREGTEESHFSFPMPLLVVLASFCLLSAMYCPMLFVAGKISDMGYAYVKATEMARTENIVFFNMVILLAVDLVYCLGWLHKKVKAEYKPVLGTCVCCAAVLICIVSCTINIKNDTKEYLTATAIDDIKDQTAAYFGYQMEENTKRLMSDEMDVLVMPIAVNPDSLYPYDAEDWKEGAVLFYQKNSVQYESEPYVFTR